MADLHSRLGGPSDPGLHTVARSALLSLGDQLDNLAEEIGRIEQQLMAWHRQSVASQRLETIWTCHGLMPLP